MKSMTCKQLGGACEEVLSANTFEELVELSKAHGMAMFTQQDPAHLEAIMKVQVMMQTPGAMEEWIQTKRKEFDSLPED